MENQFLQYNLPLKLFRATVANADLGSLVSPRVSPYIPLKMFVPFEQNLMVQATRNFELFDQKKKTNKTKQKQKTKNKTQKTKKQNKKYKNKKQNKKKTKIKTKQNKTKQKTKTKNKKQKTKTKQNKKQKQKKQKTKNKKQKQNKTKNKKQTKKNRFLITIFGKELTAILEDVSDLVYTFETFFKRVYRLRSLSMGIAKYMVLE